MAECVWLKLRRAGRTQTSEFAIAVTRLFKNSMCERASDDGNEPNSLVKVTAQNKRTEPGFLLLLKEAVGAEREEKQQESRITGVLSATATELLSQSIGTLHSCHCYLTCAPDSKKKEKIGRGSLKIKKIKSLVL